MKNVLMTICAAVAATVGAPLALAHGNGVSLEREAGKYHVDIGVDAFRLVAGRETRFTFTLIENAGSLDWHPATFDAVHAEIRAGESSLRSAEIRAASGGVFSLAHAFDGPVDHTLHVSYHSGATVLATAEFLLEVGSDVAPGIPAPRGKRDLLMWAGVIISGIFLLWSLRMIRRDS